MSAPSEEEKFGKDAQYFHIKGQEHIRRKQSILQELTYKLQNDIENYQQFVKSLFEDYSNDEAMMLSIKTKLENSNIDWTSFINENAINSNSVHNDENNGQNDENIENTGNNIDPSINDDSNNNSNNNNTDNNENANGNGVVALVNDGDDSKESSNDNSVGSDNNGNNNTDNGTNDSDNEISEPAHEAVTGQLSDKVFKNVSKTEKR